MECINPNSAVGLLDNRRDYVLTTNEWFEVESLGRTVHFETESIYYEEYRATSPGQAKQMFFDYGAFDDIKFTDIKCRLRKNVSLF